MTDRQRTKNKRTRKIARAVNIALSAAIVLLLCWLAVKIFFVTSLTVRQMSMYPTYKDTEKVYVNRLGTVERGAVAVYFDGDVAVPRLASSFSFFRGGATLLIKRVVALAGDEIWLESIEGGYALVIGRAGGGEPLREEYTGRNGAAVELPPLTPDTAGVLYGATRWDPYLVAEGCAFMIGDNRPVSHDSRTGGDVPLSRIVGIAIG